MGVACKLQSRALALAGVALLAGCTVPAREPAPGAGVVPTIQMPHEGPACAVDPQRSLLTIRVYRGGTLAKAGHNHLVASHDVTGTAYVPDDLTRASFELSVPVAKLTVDEAGLRAQEGPDFAAEVPDSAREGTRRNMLGEALLDAARHPLIALRSVAVSVVGPDELLAQVQVRIKDHAGLVTVPIRHEKRDGALIATGEFALRHSEVGLTPFSVMLGAMQVQDEMKVRFRIHCAAEGTGSPPR